MLKCDLHIHTKEDPEDKISYSAKTMIKFAKKLDYDVIAVTLHNKLFFSHDLRNFARRQGVLLIPGMEATIEGKHVLLHDIKQDPIIFDFEELENMKNDMFITAAHPLYRMAHSIGRNTLFKYHKLWDSVEYSHFYTTHFNMNKSAEPFCRRFKVPFIGNSDAHHLHDIGFTYSLVDADKNKDSVLEAIRKHKVKLNTRPEPGFQFFEDIIWSVHTKLPLIRNVFK
ncbi:PHP domain-containing protein [Candidatus Woesearchaeota archaeon]|nr:PHP domain-containing protein [Candidatus Woesearchaeota archaeon]